MGGKKQQRTKGNVQPSKSSRAAEMLSQEQSGGFVGFGGLKEAAGNSLGYVPRVGIGVGGGEDAEFEADSELRMVMRRMTKKDTTTRLKAIQDFCELCSTKSKEDVQGILPFWPKIYNKLALDVDHRAREATQVAHCQVISQAGRKLAPFLKLIISNWLLSQFDPSVPAATAAKKAFESAFSSAKQTEAILFCRSEIFESFQNNLFHCTSDTLSDPKVVPKEERDAKYYRLISCTLLAINHIVWSTGEEVNEKLSDDFKAIIKEKKFWKLSKQTTPLVRGAFYELLSTLIEKQLNILTEVKHSLCNVAFDAINEASPAVVKYSWNCILQTVKCIEDCWNHVNVHKFVLPKLWSLLKASGHGNYAIVYPCILPLLNKLPKEITGNGKEFYSTFFSKFKEGLVTNKPTSSVTEKKAIAASFMSCMKHVLSAPCVHKELFESEDERNKQENDVLSALADMLVLDLVKTAILESSAWVEDLFKHIRITMEHLLFLHHKSLDMNSDRLLYILKSLERNFGLLLEIVIATENSKAFTVLENLMKHLEPTVDTKDNSSDANLQYFMKITTDLQSQLCKLCHKAMAETQTMPYIVLLTNVVASCPLKPIILEIYRTLEKTDNLEDIPDAQLCLCAAKTFIKSYVVENWRSYKESDPVTDLDNATVQKGLIHFICRLVLVLENEDLKLEYCSSLLKLVISREYLCNVVNEVSQLLTKDLLRRWLCSSGAASELMNYLKETLTKRLYDEHVMDLWVALRRIIKPMELQDLVLEDEVINTIALLLKSKFCEASADPDFKLIQTELVGISMKFIMATENKCFASALEVFIGLVHFMIYSDNVSAICEDVVLHALRLFEMSGNSVKIWVKLGLWIKNTYKNIRTSSRLRRLLDFIRQMVQVFTSQDSCRALANKDEIVSFLFDFLPSKVDLQLCCFDRIEPKILLPFVAISRGIMNLGELPSQEQRSIPGDTDQFPLALPLFSFHILDIILGLQEFIGDELARISTEFLNASSAVCLQQYIQGHYTGFRTEQIRANTNVEEDVKGIDSDMLNTEQIMKVVLQNSNFPDEILIVESIKRSLQDGSLATVNFNNVLQTLSCLKSSQYDERLFESFGCTDYSNEVAVNSAVVAISHMQDLSIIRALLEQYVDELNAMASANNQDARGLMRLCFASMQRWHFQLKQDEADLADYREFIPRMLDILISWKDSNNDMLLFTVKDACKVSVETLEINLALVRLLGLAISTAAMSLQPDHWDFLLCACASWIQTCEAIPLTEPGNEAWSLFADSVLNVIAILNDIFDKRQSTHLSRLDPIQPSIKPKYEWLSIQPDFTSLVQVDDKRITEWDEFFSPSIHRSTFNLCRKVISTKSNPDDHLNQAAHRALLRCLSLTLMKFPSMVLSDIIYGRSGNEGAISRDSGKGQKPSMNELRMLFSLLEGSLHNVNIAAYQLLARLSRVIHQDLCQVQELEEGPLRSIPRELMDILESSTSLILSIFNENGAWVGEPLNAVKDEDAQCFLAYLLSWLLIFRIIKVAPASSRAAYASFLSQEDLLYTFMVVVFSIMPANQGWNPGYGDRQLSISYEKLETHDLQKLAFAAYYTGLECTPALIRSVWNNSLDRKSGSIIEKFTSRLISPSLCSQEMNLIQASCSSFNNMEVKCRPTAREVAAIYSIEDITMELVVKLSHCHPLALITVECGKRVGVSTAQWRQWMLQLTMFLTQQNGSVLDGLTLWKKNVDKKFEGIEECMICFSVIHGSNYSLPSIGCKTCKKKFHAACLYKWFHTSNNSTCPLCRNTF